MLEEAPRVDKLYVHVPTKAFTAALPCARQLNVAVYKKGILFLFTCFALKPF